MNIGDLEQAVIDRLKTRYHPEYLIRPSPEDPREYARLPIQAGALLVQYAGSRYEIVAQGGDLSRSVLLVVNLVIRDLQSHRKAYELIEGIRDLLDGEKIPGFGELVCRSDQFAGRTENLWLWLITFELNTC